MRQAKDPKQSVIKSLSPWKNTALNLPLNYSIPLKIPSKSGTALARFGLSGLEIIPPSIILLKLYPAEPGRISPSKKLNINA